MKFGKKTDVFITICVIHINLKGLLPFTKKSRVFCCMDCQFDIKITVFVRTIFGFYKQPMFYILVQMTFRLP